MRSCHRGARLIRNVGQTKTMTEMTYEEKMYGIVIVRPDHDRRLFGRVRRSSKGDVYAIWAEDQSPANLGQGSNPHASYHWKGQLHSKSHNRRTVTRNLQPPNRSFVGNQPIDATNADRGLRRLFRRLQKYRSMRSVAAGTWQLPSTSLSRA